MFEDKGSGCVDVTFDADFALPGASTKIMAEERPVGIMTVGAGHQAFVHPMVFWFGKIRLNIAMAPVTEHWLSRGKQTLPLWRRMRRMNGMAARASDAIPEMGRSHEILMAFALFVAA